MRQSPLRANLCLVVPALMAYLGRAPAAFGHARLRSAGTDADGSCAGGEGGSKSAGESALAMARKLRAPAALRCDHRADCSRSLLC